MLLILSFSMKGQNVYFTGGINSMVSKQTTIINNIESSETNINLPRYRAGVLFVTSDERICSFRSGMIFSNQFIKSTSIYESPTDITYTVNYESNDFIGSSKKVTKAIDTYKFGFLQIPINLSINLMKTKGPYLFLGSNLNLNLLNKHNIQIFNRESSNEEQRTVNLTVTEPDVKTISFGYTAGLGYKIKSSVSTEISYELISNVGSLINLSFLFNLK